MFKLEGTWLALYPRASLADDATVASSGSGFSLLPTKSRVLDLGCGSGRLGHPSPGLIGNLYSGSVCLRYGCSIRPSGADCGRWKIGAVGDLKASKGDRACPHKQKRWRWAASLAVGDR